MNQILATSNNENNKSEKFQEEDLYQEQEQFAPQADNDRMREIDFSDSFSEIKKNSMDIKKIMIFFGIAIGVFGLILLGVFGVKSFSGKSNKVIAKPEVSVEIDETSAIITAKAEAGINKIIYYWDETDKNELQANGKTSYEKIIDLPNGEYSFVVKVIDEKGQEIETSEEVVVDGDSEKPKISVEVVVENGVNKLKITATDDTELKYVTYKWNIGEEKRIDVETEGDNTIEKIIDIEKGNNTITIKAVDAAENIETIEKTFNAQIAPNITVGVEDDKLVMKITHEIGFEKVVFSINDKEYKYDENFSGYKADQKTLEYTFTLKEGKNIVKIVATGIDGGTETYVGQTTYTPE